MNTQSTLSSSSSPATNYVLVIGTLDTIRDRGKAVITRAQRNDRRGKMEHLAIQVRSPYGGTFLLPLDIDPSVKGHEILRTAQEGVPIALDGEIQLIKRFDRRYATSLEDAGREVREMHLHVLGIRTPEPDEIYGTSAVWLTGIVAEPPRFMRHPELPDIQLAITVLDVTVHRPSPMAGSRAITTERMRVRVAIPVDHADAAVLYRPGNHLRIEGQVDCMIETQGGAAVDAQIDTLRRAWEGQQAELAESSDQDRRLAERAYRRARIGFLSAPRVQVLAGFAELLDGAPATMDEAYALRREYIQQVRARRASNQQMRERASGVGRGPQAASDESPVSTPIPDSIVDPIPPVRPRPRRERANVPEPAPLTEAGEDVPVVEEHAIGASDDEGVTV